MQRLLSLKRTSRSYPTVVPSAEVRNEKPDTEAQQIATTGTATTEGEEEDANSTAGLLAPAAALPTPNLKVKRVDHYYSSWTKSWKYRNSGAKVTPEMMLPVGGGDGSDPWQSFCFIVVRKLPSPDEKEQGVEPKFHITVKSPYFLKVCKDVIQEVQGLSWTAEPLELDPQLLIDFLPHFERYRDGLREKRNASAEDKYLLQTSQVLIDYLYKDYSVTVSRIRNLTSHGEITFDLLHTVFVPRTVVTTECPITGEPRALELKAINRVNTLSSAFYELLCESVDAVDDGPSAAPDFTSPDSALRNSGKRYGRVLNKLVIPKFKGTVKINSLDAFPLAYHSAEAELRKSLLARGKKWMSLRGIHHMQYKGTAAQFVHIGMKKLVRYNINSRIMIDRGAFKRLNPNYELPIIKSEQPSDQPQIQYDRWGNPDPISTAPTIRPQSKNKSKDVDDLSDDEIILTSPIVYGFSLSDKRWLEFNVQIVQPVEWSDEAFTNLVLPPGRKTMLQSLVEAHNMDLGFDDFVQGKGHGLVINLFGPPGVGKTLSAEATSEHVRRPLYVVGCGELGTSANELDQALEDAFDIATSWKAIVLIDEADVFLEQRSLHDLERNAMVAVFLRHVEYYRGILFLTTNRIKTFDEAFLSRIHVALHFRDLSHDAKKQVWRAFLAKVNASDEEFTAERLERLAEREINGRQIKNATRTANSLAVSRSERIGFGHIVETLDAMEEFAAEFAGVGK